MEDNELEALALPARYSAAVQQRDKLLSIWQDCYDYALPLQGGFMRNASRKMEKIYDATAMDAVDQLAASLLGHLTPPFTPWFGFKPGNDLNEAEAQKLAPLLEQASATMLSHFDNSSFAVELHQCFLDLVIGGTACLNFEEEEIGKISAFKFQAVPLSDLMLEEGAGQRLENIFRRYEMNKAQLLSRYGEAVAEFPEIARLKSADEKITVVEALVEQGYGYSLKAFFEGDDTQSLYSETLPESPFIAFRWMKSPGDVYGISPVMKTLPDIKTANKVVELILKNASIAVTGIWQAEDDGVLNPATVELVPGAIIPKAMGSKGLTPLDMPSRMDVSQLILNDLRSRIRHALLVDRLPQIDSRNMTATEVVARSAEISLLLGATYGRLQSEFLVPLITRAYRILQKRGEVPDIPLDGRVAQIDFRSPLARAQAQRHIQSTLSWLESVRGMGPQAMAAVDMEKAARFLGTALGVPSDLMRSAGATLVNAIENIQTQTLPNQEGV